MSKNKYSFSEYTQATSKKHKQKYRHIEEHGKGKLLLVIKLILTCFIVFIFTYHYTFLVLKYENSRESEITELYPITKYIYSLTKDYIYSIYLDKDAEGT